MVRIWNFEQASFLCQPVLFIRHTCDIECYTCLDIVIFFLSPTYPCWRVWCVIHIAPTVPPQERLKKSHSYVPPEDTVDVIGIILCMLLTFRLFPSVAPPPPSSPSSAVSTPPPFTPTVGDLSAELSASYSSLFGNKDTPGTPTNTPATTPATVGEPPKFGRFLSIPNAKSPSGSNSDGNRVHEPLLGPSWCVWWMKPIVFQVLDAWFWTSDRLPFLNI